MVSLLETYKKRLAISEGVYARDHSNQTLNEQQKLTIARVLANTSAYLNEAFSHSVGTQRADMGEYKKFCLDLTTVALPNLIANDLVIVKPMTAMTGYIQYLKFVAGTDKGGVEKGDVFNDPFRLGAMNDARMNYTSAKVAEAVESFTSGTTKVAWFPVVAGTIRALDANGVEVSDNETTAWTAAADGTITAGAYKSGKSATDVKKLAYEYDNIVIPQNDLPILNAKMEGIALEAKARRIAIYYSQMAAFQAKTETGTDLGEVLATQACAELNYQIDTEVVKLLDNAAETPAGDVTKFNKHERVGVALAEHYEGFAVTLENASQVIYDKTQRYAANYLVIASNIKPIISVMRGWKAAGNAKINGPYFAGTLNGLKVYVSPAIAPNRFFVGYNGNDLVTSAAVFAPYMAVVPTQLLGFADGGMSQGFSTLYDLKLLNKDLLVAGSIVDEEREVTID